ncbi:MAG TPA: hypothetical protein GXX15_08485 [Clostridia bacterium]|nr:hypothetical protein [Clostridia bacterium]
MVTKDVAAAYVIARRRVGTSFSTYDFWQVLKVAVVTPLSPEKVRRDFSALKGLLDQGKWETDYWCKFLLLGAGAQVSQIPPAGAGIT